MEILISADRIHTRVGEMATEIVRAYDGKPVTVVGILTGCLIFTADLIRRIDLPLRVAFVTASSYRGETTVPGRLEIRDELLPDIVGRHILLLDDILDTGKTLTRVVSHLLDRGAETVKVGVLLRKIGRQEVPFLNPTSSASRSRISSSSATGSTSTTNSAICRTSACFRQENKVFGLRRFVVRVCDSPRPLFLSNVESEPTFTKLFFLASDLGEGDAAGQLAAISHHAAARSVRDLGRCAWSGEQACAAGCTVRRGHRGDGRLPVRHLPLDFRGMRKLRDTVRDANPAVVHAFGPTAVRAARLVLARSGETNTPRLVASVATQPGTGIRRVVHIAATARRADRA